MKHIVFLIFSLLLLPQIQATPIKVNYKEEFGAAHEPANRTARLTTRKTLPILGELSDIDPSKFTPINFSHWHDLGLKPLPHAKIFHFAFQYTELIPSRLLPIEIYQLACLKDMSNPDKPVFHEGRRALHEQMLALEEATKAPVNSVYGVHKGLMSCKLFLPEAFKGSDGDKLNLVFWICGIHGPRLTDEVIAAECTGNGMAVAVVDSAFEDRSNDHLSQSLLSTGGGLLRLHQMLKSFAYVNTEAPVAFGNDYGGLILWLSMQQEILSKYGYEYSPFNYVMIANMPPLLAFKQSPLETPIQFYQGKADQQTLQGFKAWFDIQESERPTRNYYLMKETLPGEGRGFLSLPFEGEGMKLEHPITSILINKDVEEIYQEVHPKIDNHNFFAQLQVLMQEPNDPYELFAKVVAGIDGFEILTTQQDGEESDTKIRTDRRKIAFGAYHELEEHLEHKSFLWKGSANYEKIKDEIIETFSQMFVAHFDPASPLKKKSPGVVADSH